MYACISARRMHLHTCAPVFLWILLSCPWINVSTFRPDSTLPVPAAIKAHSKPTEVVSAASAAAAAPLPAADRNGRSIFHPQDRGRDYSPLRAAAQVVVGDGSAKHLPPMFAASVHVPRTTNSASGPRPPATVEAPPPFVARPFAYQPPPFGNGMNSAASGDRIPVSNPAMSVGGYVVDARGRASVPAAAMPIVSHGRRDRGAHPLTASVSSRPW